MTRKQKIALFGGLIAVPLTAFTIFSLIRKKRYMKLRSLIDPLKGGKNLKDIPDDPTLAQAFDIYYHQGATIPHQNYWKAPNKKVMGWRDDIYIAGHGVYHSMGTDEARMEGAFRAMPDKVAVSQVADSYFRRYNLDLYADMLSELNDSPLVSARIVDRVTALPDYSLY
tara:strand:+ start:141 stop:647 length:507 start_codon:yes stop_codon:yes gene_type:complete